MMEVDHCCPKLFWGSDAGVRYVMTTSMGELINYLSSKSHFQTGIKSKATFCHIVTVKFLNHKTEIDAKVGL